MLDPERSAPAWPTTYEPPTARQVVGAGLQLAVTASKPIRRASIYIGLLALGAFGPAVVLLILGLGRLLADPATADILLNDPTFLLDARPDLVTPLRMLGGLVFIGTLLLVAISVDAQAIAISQLAGVASERPLRLAEAVTRARQTFWRLLGAGLIVGLASGLVALAVTLPFGGTRANSGISFIASVIGALAVTPWAFAGAGIVLGDVGAVEALRRSVGAVSRPSAGRARGRPVHPRHGGDPDVRARCRGRVGHAGRRGARDRAGPGAGQSDPAGDPRPRVRSSPSAA